MTIDLKDELTIRANAASNVSSVVFKGEGAEVLRTENVPPFAVGGDNGGNYQRWTPPIGSHVLFVTPYSGQEGSGVAGPSIIVSYTVIDSRGATGDGD